MPLNHEIAGDGPPLVLLPCLGADLSCWGFQVPDYAARFRCISVDLPGVGLSPPPTGPTSTARQADAVAALLDAIGIARAHVAGVSLGAAVATQLAARHPGRVASLGLHSGWVATDADMRAVLASWSALAATTPTVADAVVEGIFPWAFTAEMYATRPEVLEEFGAIARSRPPQPLAGFRAQVEAVDGHDARDLLSGIRVPTLVTVGDRDRLTPVRSADALAGGIPGAELRILDGLSHAGFNEDPARFTEITLRFLASVP
ncbi:MAG TPA: alpha/beta fold hydrolase [Miltoncostaeaceae bacterium]|nr:alpha/beta fold hydrolase [Miltoncostaeaceae bacterium]